MRSSLRMSLSWWWSMRCQGTKEQSRCCLGCSKHCSVGKDNGGALSFDAKKRQRFKRGGNAMDCRGATSGIRTSLQNECILVRPKSTNILWMPPRLSGMSNQDKSHCCRVLVQSWVYLQEQKHCKLPHFDDSSGTLFGEIYWAIFTRSARFNSALQSTEAV